MNLNFLRLSGVLAVFLMANAATQGADATGIFPDPNRSVMALAREASEHLNDRDRAGVRAWKWSLAPVVASQALDVASSWNMRELNPALAGGSGRFDAMSATLKLG